MEGVGPTGELNRADSPGILKSILWYSIRQTKAGRRIEWSGKPKDVLSLRSYGKVRFEPWNLDEFVSDDVPVFQVVQFRLDVPAFLATLTERQRSIALDLAHGMTTSEAAKKYAVSAGRISQCRREFMVLYKRFSPD